MLTCYAPITWCLIDQSWRNKDDRLNELICHLDLNSQPTKTVAQSSDPQVNVTHTLHPFMSTRSPAVLPSHWALLCLQDGQKRHISTPNISKPCHLLPQTSGSGSSAEPRRVEALFCQQLCKHTNARLLYHFLQRTKHGSDISKPLVGYTGVRTAKGNYWMQVHFGYKSTWTRCLFKSEK